MGHYVQFYAGYPPKPQVQYVEDGQNGPPGSWPIQTDASNPNIVPPRANPQAIASSQAGPIGPYGVSGLPPAPVTGTLQNQPPQTPQGPRHFAAPNITISDGPVGASDWITDQTTGWVAPRQGTPLNRESNGQAYPDILTGLDYGNNAWGHTEPSGMAQPQASITETRNQTPTTGTPNPYGELGLDPLQMMPTDVNFGAMPEMAGGFSPEFSNSYWGNVQNNGSILNGYWDQSKFPTAQAAQHDLSQIPQVKAQGPDSFEALQFLLSGQGFDPATIAKMKANAGDTISSQGAANMSAGRLAAERAGLLNSGTGIAMQEQVARDTGAARTQAMNAIDIQNAVTGNQNRVAGAGMELSRQTNTAQMANLTALQNASNLIQAMNQNVSNVQQTNMANFSGQQSRATGQAQAQTNNVQSAANNYNTAATDQSVRANQQNAGNQFNWGMAQNQMNNSNRAFNIGNQESRQGASMGNLVSLINGTQGVQYTGQGNQMLPMFNNNNPWAAVLSNYAQGSAQRAPQATP